MSTHETGSNSEEGEGESLLERECERERRRRMRRRMRKRLIGVSLTFGIENVSRASTS